MSKPSVTVSSVEITIGERSFTLTLAEAKELKRVRSRGQVGLRHIGTLQLSRAGS
jgi:hypothetical protein